MTRVISSKDESLKAGRTARRRARKPDAPTEEDIRILAYDLYDKRKIQGETGDALSDWMEAERRLSGDTVS